jgi:hypothetical protein
LKFVKNIPPADKALSEKLLNAGWQKIKEPKNLLMAILFSVPFMLLGGIISGSIIWLFYNPFEEFLSNAAFSVDLTLNLKTFGYIAAFWPLPLRMN